MAGRETPATGAARLGLEIELASGDLAAHAGADTVALARR